MRHTLQLLLEAALANLPLQGQPPGSSSQPLPGRQLASASSAPQQPRVGQAPPSRATASGTSPSRASQPNPKIPGRDSCVEKMAEFDAAWCETRVPETSALYRSPDQRRSASGRGKTPSAPRVYTSGRTSGDGGARGDAVALGGPGAPAAQCGDSSQAKLFAKPGQGSQPAQSSSTIGSVSTGRSKKKAAPRGQTLVDTILEVTVSDDDLDLYELGSGAEKRHSSDEDPRSKTKSSQDVIPGAVCGTDAGNVSRVASM